MVSLCPTEWGALGGAGEASVQSPCVLQVYEGAADSRRTTRISGPRARSKTKPALY
jgi:hypothetical protein